MNIHDRFMKKAFKTAFFSALILTVFLKIDRSFAVDSSLTSDIINYTRFQESMVSNSSESSDLQKSSYEFNLKNINRFLQYVYDFKGAVNDAIEDTTTVPEWTPPQANNFYIVSGKCFQEYLDGNSETITISFLYYTGTYDWDYDTFKQNGIDLHPNEFLVERRLSDGTYRAFKLRCGGTLNLSHSGGVRVYNSSSTWTVSYVNGTVSDNSFPSSFSWNSVYFQNLNSNTTKNINFDIKNAYQYSNRDYRILNADNTFTNVLKYPQDYSLIKGITFNYKNKSDLNYSLSNRTTYQINTLALSYGSTNSSTIQANYNNLYRPNNYPGLLAPFNYVPIDFNNKTPDYINTIFNNNNIYQVLPDGKIDIDTDLITDLLPDLIPDFDLKIKPVFEFQPDINANFTLSPTLNFNYLDLFDDIVFPPDTPGGGGGGGGGDITVNIDFPEYPEHTTTYLLTALQTTYSTNYIDADIDDDTLTTARDIVNYGINFWQLSGLLSIGIFIFVFGVFWRFTGED